MFGSSASRASSRRHDRNPAALPPKRLVLAERLQLAAGHVGPVRARVANDAERGRIDAGDKRHPPRS